MNPHEQTGGSDFRSGTSLHGHAFYMSRRGNSCRTALCAHDMASSSLVCDCVASFAESSFYMDLPLLPRNMQEMVEGRQGVGDMLVFNPEAWKAPRRNGFQGLV